MSRIAVTGSAGKVGHALIPRIADIHEIIPIDLPEADVLDTGRLTKMMEGADVVIHLAAVLGTADSGKENWRQTRQDPINTRLFLSALTAAGRINAGLFIHSSSIHVEDTLRFSRDNPGRLLPALAGDFQTDVSSGYGRSKREQEVILKDHASDFSRGAVSLRLGGVVVPGMPMTRHTDPDLLEHERRVRLGHDDLGSLVRRIIERRATADYDVVNAVSDNPGRFHDTVNRYGWLPQADDGQVSHDA